MDELIHQTKSESLPLVYLVLGLRPDIRLPPSYAPWAKRKISQPFAKIPSMPWHSYIASFFAGAFLANAVPLTLTFIGPFEPGARVYLRPDQPRSASSLVPRS